MIELENLSKTFTVNRKKVEAVKNVSLTVKKGEIFGVVGYSGAGKSTLVRCINYLEKPDEGSVKTTVKIFLHFMLLNCATRAAKSA